MNNHFAADCSAETIEWKRGQQHKPWDKRGLTFESFSHNDTSSQNESGQGSLLDVISSYEL